MQESLVMMTKLLLWYTALNLPRENIKMTCFSYFCQVELKLQKDPQWPAFIRADIF